MAKNSKHNSQMQRSGPASVVHCEICALLGDDSPLILSDFDSLVRQLLHAIYGVSGHEGLRSALDSLHVITKSKPRETVGNWSAYINKLLKTTFKACSKQQRQACEWAPLGACQVGSMRDAQENSTMAPSPPFYSTHPILGCVWAPPGIFQVDPTSDTSGPVSMHNDKTMDTCEIPSEASGGFALEGCSFNQEGYCWDAFAVNMPSEVAQDSFEVPSSKFDASTDQCEDGSLDDRQISEIDGFADESDESTEAPEDFLLVPSTGPCDVILGNDEDTGFVLI